MRYLVALLLATTTQAAAVSVRYTVDYGFTGFASPAANSTLKKSGKTITVRFRLAGANGKAISATLGKQLGASRKISVVLAGPRIKATTATCAWYTKGSEFTCTIKIPAAAVTGSKQNYTITAREDLAGFTTAPATGRAKNPEIVHFR